MIQMPPKDLGKQKLTVYTLKKYSWISDSKEWIP